MNDEVGRFLRELGAEVGPASGPTALKTDTHREELSTTSSSGPSPMAGSSSTPSRPIIITASPDSELNISSLDRTHQRLQFTPSRHSKPFTVPRSPGLSECPPSTATKSPICEVPPLPKALAVLFEAAAFHPHATRPTCLIHLLEELSRCHVAKQKMEILRRAKVLEERRCAHLYQNAMQKKKRDAAAIEAHKQKLIAEEMESCSFSPSLTRAARRRPAKSQEEFLERCLEWKNTTVDRLRARYATIEADVCPQEPQLNPQSLRIAEKKRAEGGWPALWEPRKVTSSPQTDAAGSSPQKGPITRRTEQQLRSVLDNLTADGAAATANESALLSSPREGAASEVPFLSRAQQDLVRRNAQAERARRAQEEEDGGVHYANITGQPLFRPNAMPTVLVDGKRLPYSELTPAQRDDFDKMLAKHRKQDALIGYYRYKQRKKPGNEPRDLNTVLEEGQRKRAAHLQRVKERWTAEETFHPQISSESAKIAEKKFGGLRIFERPTAAGAKQMSSDAAPPEGTMCSSNASGGRLRAPDKPFFVPTCDEASQRVIQRGEAWTERREKRMASAIAAKEEQQMAECTFTPRRAQVHQQSPSPSKEGGQQRRCSVISQDGLRSMACAAEGRVDNELEVLRSQAAYADPCFLSSVLEGSRTEAEARASISNINFANAPRLHRHAFGCSASHLGHSGHRTPSVSSFCGASPIPTHSLRPSVGRSPMMTLGRTPRGGSRMATVVSPTEDARSSPLNDSQSDDPWKLLDAQVDCLLQRAEHL